MNIRTALLVLATVSMSASTAYAGYIIGYDETKSLFKNQTMMTYDRGHGTQVEYLSANGKTYLLYPGNTSIVKGAWKLDRTSTPNVFEICFKYQSNSYNPVTGQTGGGWECQIAGYYIRGVVDHADGDVLGLGKGQVPFVLAKRKTTLAKLRKQLP